MSLIEKTNRLKQELGLSPDLPLPEVVGRAAAILGVSVDKGAPLRDQLQPLFDDLGITDGATHPRRRLRLRPRTRCITHSPGKISRTCAVLKRS